MVFCICIIDIGKYADVKQFISVADQYNVHVQYVGGAEPHLILANNNSADDEVSIASWNKDTIIEYITQKISITTK